LDPAVQIADNLAAVGRQLLMPSLLVSGGRSGRITPFIRARIRWATNDSMPAS
jgi:hypothetical protein